MYQQSLNLDPFLLLIREVICSLPLFDFFVEFVDDDGNEQVHDEEGREENVDDVDHGDERFVFFHGHEVQTCAVDGVVHHSWPHFKG